MSERGELQDGSRKKGVKGWLFFALRLVISVGLMVAIIFYYVPEADRPKIITAYADTIPWWLALAVLATFTDRLVSGWKWLMLLRVREPKLPAWPVLQIFFVSTFLGYFLPSSIGGDALRVFQLSRLKGDLAGSTSSVVIDRAYGTLGLVLLSSIAVIPVIGTAITWMEGLLLWGFTLVAMAGVFLLSSRRINSWVVRTFKLDEGGKIRPKIAKLFHAFESFLHAKGQLIKIFCLSLLVQVLRVVIVVSFGMSLGFELNPLVYFIYVPVITVITFMPFSIAGIGVREALFVLFFTRPEVGLTSDQAISLSLLFFSSGIIATLPGLIIYLFFGGFRHPHQD